jgi:hypothetical protein
MDLKLDRFISQGIISQDSNIFSRVHINKALPFMSLPKDLGSKAQKPFLNLNE